MASGFASLTEKERETLRLLLRGHDAKSMAGELQLSVHTVNERLRHARRKLDVTSSKEAARLLYEQEARDPKFLGDKNLGDAWEGRDADDGEQSKDTETPRTGRGVWIIGVLAMIAAAIFLAVLAQPAAQSESDQSYEAVLVARDTSVEEAAREWLTIVDRYDWTASHEVAGEYFRENNSLAD
ncbi:helix-turn-helix domain-containing protein [Aurantiacibacter sediminis]|uniref:Helix-turn-helix transcriptional regulator n=1 Tax=Aurantiacibacter sediminis TaxID=2793064 RepID=A0ABS0MZX9_9SPHN|nr:helix-turn-helix transcriptional regulator [Aurantiacibacter sediminis]MBH5321271.1 helix-turn-helix transcriptional regulator [Aurantiacibacter sediminis]